MPEQFPTTNFCHETGFKLILLFLFVHLCTTSSSEEIEDAEKTRKGKKVTFANDDHFARDKRRFNDVHKSRGLIAKIRRFCPYRRR